jgi:ribosomal-protein-alanine N-acetyltransferase
VPSSFSDEIEISGMKEADLDEIMEIEQKSFIAPWSKNVFRETLSFPSSLNIVARKRVDNRVAGYANFYLILDEVQILNIAVAPESRRQGYGTRMLEHAIRELRKRGGKTFYLDVREGNLDAISVYRRLGFRRSEKEEVLHGDNEAPLLPKGMGWTGSTT